MLRLPRVLELYLLLSRMQKSKLYNMLFNFFLIFSLNILIKNGCINECKLKARRFQIRWKRLHPDDNSFIFTLYNFLFRFLIWINFHLQIVFISNKDVRFSRESGLEKQTEKPGHLILFSMKFYCLNGRHRAGEYPEIPIFTRYIYGWAPKT